MPIKNFLLPFFFLAFWTGGINFVSAQNPAPIVVNKTYVVEGEIDLAQFLPPPPADDSPVTKAEIQELLKWQAQRTPEQVAFAQADANLTVFRFADTMGPYFTPERLPLLSQFFGACIANVELLINSPKAYYHRTRPYLIDPDIQPVLRKPTDNSYPSGHATVGYFVAIILADMVPEKARELYVRGDSVALNRVIGGLHYPTDLEAGKLSAVLIAERMFLNAKFRQDFAKTRAELRKVLDFPDPE
jgi:acid phosphatase (class A)